MNEYLVEGALTRRGLARVEAGDEAEARRIFESCWEADPPWVEVDDVTVLVGRVEPAVAPPPAPPEQGVLGGLDEWAR